MNKMKKTMTIIIINKIQLAATCEPDEEGVKATVDVSNALANNIMIKTPVNIKHGPMGCNVVL